MTQPTGGGQASAAQTGRGGWLGVRVLLWARAGEGPRDPAEAHPCMRGSSSPGGQVGLYLHQEPHETHASLPWASHEPPTWDRGQDSACLLCSGAQIGFLGHERPLGVWQRVRTGAIRELPVKYTGVCVPKD